MDLDVLLLSITEIKQTEESPQTVPVEQPAVTALPAEPAHVERVTEKKAKDPKKVAAGRAGAAGRQKRLLEQLQAAKESLRPPVRAADNDGMSASPKEAKRTDERPEPNWIPEIIGAYLAVGGGGAGGGRRFTCLCLCGRKHALARQSRVGGGRPRAKVQDKFPKLKACPTPTIWNNTMTTPATDGKMLVNALYHSAVVFGLAAGYARLGKMAIGVAPRSLTLRPATLAWSWWTSLSPWRPKRC